VGQATADNTRAAYRKDLASWAHFKKAGLLNGHES
jgi:hypothetical protein